MVKKTATLLILSLLFLLATPALAGGWVVITLDELPAVRAGEPVTLGFMVRQHGIHPVDDVNVVVSAQHLATGERREWTAAKGTETGHFAVEAAFTQPGEWVWEVTAEPFPQVTKLPPLNVLPAVAVDSPDAAAATVGALLRVTGVGLLAIGALLAVVQRRRPGLLLGLGGGLLLLLALASAPQPAPAADAAPPAQSTNQTPAEVGAALFQAKGCVTCHRHDALPATGSLLIGPDLSDYVPDPEFVRAWLRDPAAIRPNTQMPNLGLDDTEIEALLAFLAEGSEQASVGRAACPVTVPIATAFAPPSPDPAGPLYKGTFWHGSLALRTALHIDGVWERLPRHEHGYTQKLPFWSEGYDWRQEPEPELRLHGRQLDGDAVMEAAGASNAHHDDHGSFIMTGFVLPTAGCWEVTAEYRDANLTFIVWVAP